MRILLILAFLLLLAPAVSAANRGAVNFDEHFEVAHIEVFLDIAGADAVEMRQAIDAFGDKDGKVTNGEGDEYADHLNAHLGQQFLAAVRTNWTLDGHSPTDVAMTEFEFYDAAGAVSSQETVILEVVMRAKWEPIEAERHAFVYTAGQMGRVQGFPDPVRMSIKAAPGYTVTDVGDFQGIEFSQGQALAQFDDEAEGPSMVVLGFGKDANAVQGAPGLGFGACLVLVGIAAAMRRRF